MMLFLACHLALAAGFAQSATNGEIAKHGHVLTPGRYVGAEDVEDDGEEFAVKYPRLVAEVKECLAQGERLSNSIRKNLRLVAFESRAE